MAHRGVDRDREPVREPGRDLGRDRDRERDRAVRDRDPRREPIRDRPRGEAGLNEFFVPGDGIHRDVMQREICKYLGPEAYSRPGTYNGTAGYIVTAVRPFTPKMIEDLQMLSEDWVTENQNRSRSGYEGSPTRSSPVDSLPNDTSGVPYPQSQASRRSDRSDPALQGVQDTYDSRNYISSAYSSTAAVQPSYTPTSGYPPQGPGYSPQQLPGYSPTTYPPVSTYPPSAAYPQGTMYPPSGQVYPTASAGYQVPGYTAPVGRPANPEENYTWQNGDSYNQYQYRQPGAYQNGAPPRDARADPRADPRAPGYPYVTAAQDVPMRGVPIDERYAYGQSLPTTAAGRPAFPAQTRPPGGYDSPPPRDGFDSREPARDDRRRR